MRQLRNAKIAYVLISVAMIALGAILILWPEISALAVCNIIGAILAVFGIIKLVGYFSRDMYRLAFQFDLALGIFSVLVGLLMLVHPTSVVMLVPVIIGVFVILDGTFKLQTAYDAKRFGMGGWWGILLLAIVTCLGGLFLVINPFQGANALMILLGITLAVDGIQNLCVAVYTVKNYSVRIDFDD